MNSQVEIQTQDNVDGKFVLGGIFIWCSKIYLTCYYNYFLRKILLL